MNNLTDKLWHDIRQMISLTSTALFRSLSLHLLKQINIYYYNVLVTEMMIKNQPEFRGCYYPTAFLTAIIMINIIPIEGEDSKKLAQIWIYAVIYSFMLI